MTISDKQLKIDTTGWVEISCDKCGQVCLYDPSVVDQITQCFGCMPVTTPEEFDRLAREGKIR